MNDVYLEDDDAEMLGVRLKQRTTGRAIAKRERQANARKLVKKDNIVPRQKIQSLRGTKEQLHEEISDNDKVH